MSDPIATRPIPAHLQQDERLRVFIGCSHLRAVYPANSRCWLWSGRNRASPLSSLRSLHIQFGRPFTLESLDSVSFKVPIPEDGPSPARRGFTLVPRGFDDSAGHFLQRGNPASVCDKTAAKLAALIPGDILITDSTWHYTGGGCC